MSDTPRPPPGDAIPLDRRAAIVAVAVVLNGALYLAINARLEAAAHLLSRSTLDTALGFHAWTIWPYWLLILLAPAMALCISRRVLLVATLRAYAVALALNASLWLALPTRLHRAPLPHGLDAATEWAWQLLYALDGPGNCFPSGHVTLPLVFAGGFALQHPRAGRAAWLLIALLVPTVVTTGQHVALDVLGGVTTAFLGLVLTLHPFVRRQGGAREFVQQQTRQTTQKVSRRFRPFC